MIRQTLMYYIHYTLISVLRKLLKAWVEIVLKEGLASLEPTGFDWERLDFKTPARMPIYGILAGDVMLILVLPDRNNVK